MFIAIDFDGTIVEHEYPSIGPVVPGAIEWMKKFQEMGYKLILLTMRSDDPGQDRKVLTAAVKFCRKNGIEFWAVNDNPEQVNWTLSRKVYAHYYIDDAAVGCPLIKEEGKRPYVDWEKIGPMIPHLS